MKRIIAFIPIARSTDLQAVTLTVFTAAELAVIDVLRQASKGSLGRE